MKLKLFFSAGLLFFSGAALSATNCVVTPNTDFTIELSSININPGAQVGDIVGESEIIERTILCDFKPTPDYDSMVAYYDTNPNKGTGVFVEKKLPGTVNISRCEAMESGYPGLGIVWFNYNSANSNRWLCASKSESTGDGLISRVLSSGIERTIKDQVFLVKTGPIGTGNFNFDQTYQFEERARTSNFLPNFGPLYKVIILGETKIESPTCTATNSSENKEYLVFNILNDLKSDINQSVNILCTGYIEDGTVVPFQFLTKDGVFTQNNQYYASSVKGLGINISYKIDGDTNFIKLTPSQKDVINVPIYSGKSVLNFRIEPYIEKDSGVYPLSDSASFNVSIKAGG
ncbi:hypothetical protein AB7303_20035 [Providencia rettgeri]